jgi:hypothetical protein
MGIADFPDPGIEKKKMGRPGFKQAFFDKYVKDEMPELLQAGIQMAKDKDPIMLKFFLERGLPKQAVDTDHTLEITSDAIEQIDNIMHYHLAGNCTMDDAIKMVAMVKEKVMLSKFNQFEGKLLEFEEWMKNKSDGTTQGVTYDGES